MDLENIEFGTKLLTRNGTDAVLIGEQIDSYIYVYAKDYGGYPVNISNGKGDNKEYDIVSIKL